ncbi:PIN domain-containing protein [Nocardia sp. NPDC004278]
MPIIIVIDANILVSSPRLRTRAWRNLIEQRSNWGIRFIVPEVALMEAVKNVRELWEEELRKVKRLKVAEFGLDVDKQAWIDTIQAKVEDYEQDLRALLNEIGAEIVAPPAVDHMDLARRSAAGRAPFSAKDKDCYRDALIWHSVLETARHNLDDQVWFVSDNTDDFGPASKDWNGEGTGDRKGGPILFHDDLTADLISASLHDRVRYITNVHSLDQFLAGEFAPVSSDEFQNLMDAATLTARFQASVVGQLLRPRDAALNPDAVTAIVTLADPDNGFWEFFSAAQRGSDGWSARYTVTAIATYTSSDDLGKLSIGHKKLIFSGDIAVAPDKSIADFVIESVNALPDDPNRALWPDPVSVRQMTQEALDSAGGEESVRQAASEVLHASGAFREIQKTATETFRTSDAMREIQKTAAETFRTSGAFQEIQKIANERLRATGGAESIRDMADEVWRRQRDLGL